MNAENSQELTIFIDGQTTADYVPSLENAIAQLDGLVEQWLEHIYEDKSKSERTVASYREMMRSYRRELQAEGLDLLSPFATHRQMATIAKRWARVRSARAIRTGEVSDSTYNLRLAAISSFFVYIQKQQKLEGMEPLPNPIDRVERRKIEAYAHAAPPLTDEQEISQALNSIDRSTTSGKRDYALLAIALYTGRRASELLKMTYGDLALSKRIRIKFPKAKGAKEFKDLLDAPTSAVFYDYLYAAFGKDALPAESRVWISFSNRNKGQAISIDTLSDICKRVLDTSKIHVTRHTFAYHSEKNGATVSDIQHRLGHASINQTGTYLQAIRSDDNPIGGKLSSSFGIHAYEPTRGRPARKRNR